MKITKTDGDGDVTIEFQRNGTTQYIAGIDDTDNLFKIHAGTSLLDNSDFTINLSGIITTGTWQGTGVSGEYLHTDVKEGTAIVATGITGTTNYLREDGDGTCSWQTILGATDIDSLTDAKLGGANFADSIIIGHQTTGALNNANYNVSVGLNTINEITSGDYNVAIGYDAGTSLTEGSGNVFIGYHAGDSATNVDETVLIGTDAGADTLQGVAVGDCDGTIAVGYNSLNALKYGKNNTSIGYQSLALCVGKSTNTNIGGYNTAVGYGALDAETGNSLGYKNTAIGSNAFGVLDETKENTAIGYQAGKSVTGSDYITLVGTQAGEDITNCQRTVCIGYDSGIGLMTGDDCIYVGYKTVAASSSNSSEIVVGHALTGKGGSKTFIGGSSAIFNEANITTWKTTSDKRLKRNIEPCDIGLNEIDQIRIVKYQFKSSKETPKKHNYDSNKIRYGVIAQEIQKILPKTVSQDKDGWLAVDSDPLIWGTINSVKELYITHKKQHHHIKKTLHKLNILKQKQDILKRILMRCQIISL